MAFRRFSPELKTDLFREIARVKGFEKGYYPELSGVNSNFNVDELKTLIAQNRAVMAENLAIMREIREQGIQAFLVMDFPTMRDLKKVEEDYTIHQNKNRA